MDNALAVFDAILFATSQGIVVVEAGGNGSVDLDTYQDVSGKKVQNRRSADFRDSGAIIVGAASSAAPHKRLSFSNYGSRIDCFAWGENIDTCGDGWTGTSINTYTSSFGGTSGASPIVAGAALLLQSPGGTLCIKCGAQDPGYIGDPLVNSLAIVSIVLGLVGLISQGLRSTGRS